MKHRHYFPPLNSPSRLTERPIPPRLPARNGALFEGVETNGKSPTKSEPEKRGADDANKKRGDFVLPTVNRNDNSSPTEPANHTEAAARADTDDQPVYDQFEFIVIPDIIQPRIVETTEAIELSDENEDDDTAQAAMRSTTETAIDINSLEHMRRLSLKNGSQLETVRQPSASEILPTVNEFRSFQVAGHADPSIENVAPITKIEKSEEKPLLALANEIIEVSDGESDVECAGACGGYGNNADEKLFEKPISDDESVALRYIVDKRMQLKKEKKKHRMRSASRRHYHCQCQRKSNSTKLRDTFRLFSM